jgi:hypothetical protein
MKPLPIAATVLGLGALLAAPTVQAADPGRDRGGVVAYKAAAILGTWDSDWGPVTFRGRADGRGGVVKFTGTWAQGPNQIGVIKEGVYDPATRKLVFFYYQDWNDQHGEADFLLSDDGRTLSGAYNQTNGSGRWTMTRQ